MRSLILLVALASSAWAEPTARELFEQGTAAYALGHYHEAAEAYEKAFSLKPDPALLYNAAQAQRQAGNKKRALLLYENYVRLYGNRIPNREEVMRLAATLKRAIEADERISSAPPSGPVVPGRPAPPPTATLTQPPVEAVTPPPVKEDRPLVKKGWFWGVLVGSAAAVGLAVGLGVGLSGSTRDPSASLGHFQAD